MNNSRHRFILSLLTAFTALTVTDTACGATRMPPRLVVNILVDQLRSDYMEAFMPLYGEDGFKRILQNGMVYENASYNMAHVDRASAAATIVTGTEPFNHGIIASRWLDRQTLRPVYCVDDATTKGQGTLKTASPKNLNTSTISDELKVSTDGQAYVYAISPNRDLAVITGGHAADGVFWIDDETGAWCTSDYYCSLPEWVNKRDLYQPIENIIKNTEWTPLNDNVTYFSYFLSGKSGKAFKRKFNGDYRFMLFKNSGLVNEEVAGMVDDCLNHTPLGEDDVTDYLAVTLYAGNYDNLPISEAPVEMQDTYARLDRALEHIMKSIERKVGADGVLFVVTSTGYTTEEPNELKKYRIPTGTFDMKRSAALLNIYLQAIYGRGNYVDAAWGEQIYLNRKLLEDKQLDYTEITNRSEAFLQQLSGIEDVYTSTRILLGAHSPGIQKIRNSFNKRHSGDILLSVSPGWHLVNIDTHEDHLSRSAYIPFPIIFMGAGVQAEKVDTPVNTQCIAPTLARTMRIRAPNACDEVPLSIMQP